MERRWNPVQAGMILCDVVYFLEINKHTGSSRYPYTSSTDDSIATIAIVNWPFHTRINAAMKTVAISLWTYLVWRYNTVFWLVNDYVTWHDPIFIFSCYTIESVHKSSIIAHIASGYHVRRGIIYVNNGLKRSCSSKYFASLKFCIVSSFLHHHAISQTLRNVSTFCLRFTASIQQKTRHAVSNIIS